MEDQTKNTLARLMESLSLSAMLTLVAAIMFVLKQIEIPLWAWAIEFVILTVIAFVTPRPERRELTVAQKRLMLFSTVAATVLAIVLFVILAVS